MPQRTTPAAVDRIAGMADPVLRNFEITQSYHELSLVLFERTGPAVNWCTFAAWASNQAGQTIRREDLIMALKHALESNPELGEAEEGTESGTSTRGAGVNVQALAKLVWETIDPRAAMDRASAAVARGNQKVYDEIARAFARFAETCLKDSAFDAKKIADFCETLKPGDPPDGQGYLQRAFQHYYQAFFEPDDKQKSELVLLANIEIGFHEQTRLQPEIAEALEASVVFPKDFKSKLTAALFPNQSWIAYLMAMLRDLFHLPSPLDPMIDNFAQKARHRIRLFLTAHLMELGFPNTVRLPLGKDLKTPFPARLQTLSNPDLMDFLRRIDPTPDDLKDTGTTDWANLDDRLHFIADLFRCYQEVADLLQSPQHK